MDISECTPKIPNLCRYGHIGTRIHILFRKIIRHINYGMFFKINLNLLNLVSINNYKKAKVCLGTDGG